MTTKQKYRVSSRVFYLDSLRVFATIAVIILHTAASQWSKTPVDSFNWRIFNVYDSLVRWCVPIFLMISGVFFLDITKNISRRDIYHKYIKRIVIALFFWGFLYETLSLVVKSFISNEPVFLFDMMQILAKFVVGPPWYHLWFLYLIIGIYMLVPLFRVFIFNSKKEDIEYLLILFFLLGLLLPGINGFLLVVNAKYNINFSVVELTGYVGYFFAGYYFHKNEVTNKIKYSIYSLGTFSALFTIIATAKWSLWTCKPQGFFYSYLLPTTMFEAYAVFLLFKDMFGSFKCSARLEKVMLHLSGCSFGIYLVHDFIIQMCSIIKIGTTRFNPIVMIPALSIINFAVSLMIVSLIKRIPHLNKYII